VYPEHVEALDRRLQMLLPQSLWERTVDAADTAEQSIGQWVRQAIRERLEREKCSPGGG
jgi:predicted HicB family RNase H-like nuclease